MNCKNSALFDYEVIAFLHFPLPSPISLAERTIGQNCCTYSSRIIFDIVMNDRQMLYFGKQNSGFIDKN